MRSLAIVVTALLLVGATAATAAEPTRLAASRYAIILGDRGAERLASYAASLIDEVAPRAARLTGTPDISPVIVILYRDHHRFAIDTGTLNSSVLGVTTYPSGIIRLDVSHADLTDIKHAIPHETAHVMVGRAVGSSYPGLALWFNEGVAEIAAGEYAVLVDAEALAALRAGQTIPLADLDSALHQRDAIRYNVGVAYAESLSLVRFLTAHYGEEVIARLLSATRRQGDFPAALKEVTGLTEGELETQWNDSLRPTASWITLLDPNLLVWAAMVVLLLAAVVRYWVVRRRRDRESGIEGRESGIGNGHGRELGTGDGD